MKRGSYCLLMRLKRDCRIRIGKLGKLFFKKGYYLYVGSALNSLEARIRRHIQTNKGITRKKFWHIDYFLTNKNVELLKVFYIISNRREECTIAKSIKGKAVPKFGCSDCKCESHLFKVSQRVIQFLEKRFTSIDIKNLSSQKSFQTTPH